MLIKELFNHEVIIIERPDEAPNKININRKRANNEIIFGFSLLTKHPVSTINKLVTKPCPTTKETVASKCCIKIGMISKVTSKKSMIKTRIVLKSK